MVPNHTVLPILVSINNQSSSFKTQHFFFIYYFFFVNFWGLFRSYVVTVWELAAGNTLALSFSPIYGVEKKRTGSICSINRQWKSHLKVTLICFEPQITRSNDPIAPWEPPPNPCYLSFQWAVSPSHPPQSPSYPSFPYLSVTSTVMREDSMDFGNWIVG